MHPLATMRAMDYFQDASDELIGDRQPAESILPLIVEIKYAVENLFQHRASGELPFRHAAKPAGKQCPFGGRQHKQRSPRRWYLQIEPVKHSRVLRMSSCIVWFVWRGDKYIAARQMVFPSSGAVGLVSPLEVADLHGPRVRVRLQPGVCGAILVASEYGHLRKSNRGKVENPAFPLDLMSHGAKLVLYRIKVYLMEGRTNRNFVWALWALLFTAPIGIRADELSQRLEAAQRAERVQDYASASREYTEILKLQPNLPLIRQSLAITYHLQNRYAEAISEFQRALRLDPALWGTDLFLGMDYYKTNQFELAISPLEKSISLNSQMAEPEARFWLGAAYSALNRPEDAVRELRRDLELRPKDVDVLYSLTQAYDQSAASVFEQLGQIEPRSAAVSLLQAERFSEENRADLARLEYRNAVRLRPDFAGWIPALAGGDATLPGDTDLTISFSDAHANLEMAALFSSIGDDRDALAILGNLAVQKAADAKTRDSIAAAKSRLEAIGHPPATTRTEGSQEALEGIQFLRQGRFRDAQKPLAEASARNPNEYLRLCLIRSYLEAGDSVPAENEIRKFLTVEPKSIDALHLLGRNYKRQAEAALQRMIEIDADSYGVHELLGRQHEERTEFDLAIQEYQAALAKRQDAGGVRYAIGNVYRKMSQYDQAEHWLTDEIKRNPYHGLAQYSLGSVYIAQGKPDEAIPHLELALRSHPHLTDARLDLGRAYTAKGRYQEAIATLRQVAASEPDNDRVHYLLSAAYSKQGKREEAQLELATYQRLTRRRLQRTQQDVRDASDSLAGKGSAGPRQATEPGPPQ